MAQKKRGSGGDQNEGANQDADQANGDPTNTHDEALRPGDTLCGLACFKPSCMQPFARMYVFIPTLSLSIIATFAYNIYVLSQVTTLEKQFRMTSTESGILLGVNDVGFMLSILLWSHFAKKMHKPRLLSLSAFMFALAAAISVIPHFLMITQASDMYETGEISSSGAFDSRSLCLARNLTESMYSSEISANSARIRRIGYALIFVAFGLQGISRSPRMPLAQTYIDDNVSKTQTGVYMGAIFGIAFLGPVLGSSLGGVVSQIYVTLEETSLGPRDPRFIGAWWIGFAIFAAITFVAAMPLLLFPKGMPNAPVVEEQDPSMSHKDDAMKLSKLEVDSAAVNKEIATQRNTSSPVGKIERLKRVAKPFFSSLLRIFKNPLYMLIVACDSAMFLTIAGRIAFYPKYLEQHFRMATSRSNFFFGVTMLLPVGFGGIFGGFLTNRLRLTIRGCMILRVLTSTAGAIIMFLSLIVTCDQPIIYGLSNSTVILKITPREVTNMTCDTKCMCEREDFLPSCGSDDRTYFSPCHAGCTEVLANRDFGNCECVPETTSFNQTVKPGYCEDTCDSIIYYFILSALGSFIGGMEIVTTNLTQLRSVQERDRSMSVGLAGLMRSIIGFFAGPILFGMVIDTSCLVSAGSCLLYDGNDLRIKLHAFIGGVMGVICIVNIVIAILPYKMDRYCEIVEWQRQVFDKEMTKNKTGGLKGELEPYGDVSDSV